MSHMVVEQMAENDSLSIEEAQAAVVASVTESGLNASEELIFGDYLAETSDTAQALNIIGETLVDAQQENSSLSAARQLELTSAVAEEAQKVIDDPTQDLSDFSPIVDIPSDPTQPITVTPNERPVHDQEDGQLDNIKMNEGEAWIDLEVASNFSDANGDRLTYSMIELTGAKGNELNINPTTGVITADKGVLNNAGSYEYQIFAEDTAGATSYPLALNVEVVASNQAPTVNMAEFERIQTEIADTWMPQVGSPLEHTIDVTNLFEDADGNIVEYRTRDMSIDGLSVSPPQGSNPIITVSGTPTTTTEEGASEHFVIGGVDNEGASYFVEMPLPVVEEGVSPGPGPNPDPDPNLPQIEELQNTFLYYSDIGGTNVVWCDAVYFDSFSHNVYWSARSSNHNKQCPTFDNDTPLAEYISSGQIELGGKYSISNDGNEFNVEYNEEADVRATYTLKASSIWDEYLDHHFLTYKEIDAENQSSTETVSLYPNRKAVEEEVLYHPLSTSKNNPNWVTRVGHAIQNDGEVIEFDVSAILQEYSDPNPEENQSEAHYSSAEIHISGGDFTCSDFFELYPAMNFQVHEQNGSQGVFQAHYENGLVEYEGTGCYIRLHPEEGRPVNAPADPFSMAPIEFGTYTLEVEPKDAETTERLIFSFHK